MPVLKEKESDLRNEAGPPQDLGADGDRFIRLEKVLSVHRGSFTKDYVEVTDRPTGSRSCRIIGASKIRQFILLREDRWARYGEIEAALKKLREEGPGHRYPFHADVVFAPLKIVISEQGLPIKAAITQEPVYPARAKMAVLKPGWPIGMAYAAVGVLNSVIGQAYYQELVKEVEDKDSLRDGLSKKALLRMPVAAVGYSKPDLVRLAKRAYQLTVLYRARVETQGNEFDEAIQWIHGDLSRDVAQLMDLAEEDERRLKELISSLDMPDLSIRVPLFGTGKDFPPLPPVELISSGGIRQLERLRQRPAQELSLQEKADLDRLRSLECWEHLVNAELPWDLQIPSGIMSDNYPMRDEPILYDTSFDGAEAEAWGL